MPINVECHECHKVYLLKDELTGKKFKCKQCGTIVLATPMADGSRPVESKKTPPAVTKKRATNRTAESRSPVNKKRDTAGSQPPAAAPKKRPQKKRAEPNPFAQTDDGFGEAFDDDYADDYGDSSDDASMDSFGSPSPRRKKSAKRSGKKKASSGGLSIGFNIHWLNIGMVVAGIAIVFAGVNEAKLASGTQAQPTEISLSDLNANGLGENSYLTVSGVNCILDETVVYGTEKPGGDITKYDKVWIPCVPQGEEAVGRNVRFLLYSKNASTDSAVLSLANRSTFTGLIVNKVEPLAADERRLLESGFPGANLGSAMILQVDRAPSGTGAVVLYFVGGAAMSLGGLAWIFLSGTPAASVASTRSQSVKSGRRGAGADNSSKSKKAKPLTATQLLFSFQGRIKRSTWWLTSVGAGFGWLVIATIIGVIVNAINVDALRFISVFLSLGLWALAVYIQLAAAAKRWHDRDKSGLMNFIILIPVIGVFWMLIECGCLEGTRGGNQYGNEP